MFIQKAFIPLSQQTIKTMIHLTVDGKFENENQAVENVLTNQVAKQNGRNGRLPVCVKTPVSKRKMSYGMQFWTIEMIAAGYSVNTDGTTSTLC